MVLTASRLRGGLGETPRVPSGSCVLTAVQEDVHFTVVRKVELTSTIAELVLFPAHETIVPLPGQYVVLGDPDFRFPQRSYSVANAVREEGLIRLLVTRAEHGDTSGWIHDRMAVGDAVLLSGPYGSFIDDPAWTGPTLHLAGGSGLAPILALIDSRLRRDGSAQIDVLFSARRPRDVYLRYELYRWEAEFPRFRFRRTLTRSIGEPPLGHIPDVLPQLHPDLSGHLVFVAGSPGLVDACDRAARARGALPSRIRTEAFFAEPQPWHASPAPSGPVPETLYG